MKEVLASLRMRSFRKSICIQTKNMLIITESYPPVRAVTRISNIDTSASPSPLAVLPERPRINKFTYIFLIFSSTFGLFPKILDILSQTDIPQGLDGFRLESASTPALPVPVTGPSVLRIRSRQSPRLFVLPYPKPPTTPVCFVLSPFPSKCAVSRPQPGSLNFWFALYSSS